MVTTTREQADSLFWAAQREIHAATSWRGRKAPTTPLDVRALYKAGAITDQAQDGPSIGQLLRREHGRARR